LLANAFSTKPSPLTFQELGEYVPDSHRVKDRGFIEDSESIFNSLPVQLVKSHSFYSPKLHRVIYIVRDGRDVITSYYHWLNARKDGKIHVSDIIRGKSGMGSWSEHVLGWVNGKCQSQLLVKYEDLLDDAERELKRMLSFLGLESESIRIRQSVEWSSFEQLHQIEKEQGVFDGRTPGTKKVPFMRKGVAGDWTRLLTSSDVELFWDYHREAMVTVGYD
jgi:hypothetical protein